MLSAPCLAHWKNIPQLTTLRQSVLNFQYIHGYIEQHDKRINKYIKDVEQPFGLHNNSMPRNAGRYQSVDDTSHRSCDTKQAPQQLATDCSTQTDNIEQ
jgi:hypothetical protein